MKLVCISDTHNLFDIVNKDLPEGDVFIHAGDFSTNGTLKELLKFRRELDQIRSRYGRMLFVPGNHDAIFEKDYYIAETILADAGVETFIDQYVKIKGLDFYFCPWTHSYGDYSFMLENFELTSKFNRIPKCDILVTHGPPYGILDLTIKREFKDKFDLRDYDPKQLPYSMEQMRNEYLVSAGSKNLLRHICNVARPLVHIFGHIHSNILIQNRGFKNYEGIDFYNVSSVTDNGYSTPYSKATVHSATIINL